MVADFFKPQTLLLSPVAVHHSGGARKIPYPQNRLHSIQRPTPSWPYFIDSIGRGGAIRTPDPLRPRQVRYQAALRPDYRRVTHATLRLLNYSPRLIQA